MVLGSRITSNRCGARTRLVLVRPRKILKSLWRTHSCVPRSHSCERWPSRLWWNVSLVKKLSEIALLGSYFDGQALSHSVAGVVLRDQFVVGVSQRRNLNAMADGRMKLFHRRLNAHALGCVHAIADTGMPATADRAGSGVEVQNLE